MTNKMQKKKSTSGQLLNGMTNWLPNSSTRPLYSNRSSIYTFQYDFNKNPL